MAITRSFLNGYAFYYFVDGGNRQCLLKIHLQSAGTPLSPGFTTVSIGPVGQNALALTQQNAADLIAPLTYFATYGSLP
jgi:hypothetical protein